MSLQYDAPRRYLADTATETRLIQDRFLSECGETLLKAAEEMGRRLRAGGKVLLFGNGGSAADAQHTAAEMIGRMLLERRPLPAIALTTDTSNLTALGNDYGFEMVFQRQVEALAQPSDFVIAISTSGNSPNVLRGVEAARAKGCKVLGLTGGNGGKLLGVVDFPLSASLGKNSSRIQETHIFALHSLVDLVDRFFLEG